MCSVCGYAQPGDPCAVCGGEAKRLGKRGPVEAVRGNAFVEFSSSILDVRRAVFAILFEREFINKLRLPIAMNLIAILLIALLGLLWLNPAFTEAFAGDPEPSASNHRHLWLIAVWLTAGPAMLDLLAGWAQDPIRRATEFHMLSATVTEPPATGLRILDRMQMLLLIGISTLIGMALILIPWIGIAATILLGSAVAGIIWLLPPQAVRGVNLRDSLLVILKNPWRTLGTGFGLQIAAAIPFVNLLALLPIATVAGTSAYLRFDKSMPQNSDAQ